MPPTQGLHARTRRWWQLTVQSLLLAVFLAGIVIWWSRPFSRAQVYLALECPFAARDAVLDAAPGPARDDLLERIMRSPAPTGETGSGNLWEEQLRFLPEDVRAPHWARFGPQGRLLSPYYHGDTYIEAGFIPWREQVHLGEPIWLIFHVWNRSPYPYVFRVGGDTRGAPRPMSFEITGVDQQGRPVPDPHPEAFHLGGPTWEEVLPPDGSYNDWSPVEAWLTIDAPGRYRLTCRRTLGSMEAEGNEDRSALIRVVTHLELEVLPPPP
jgi:hypothetical protein